LLKETTMRGLFVVFMTLWGPVTSLQKLPISLCARVKSIHRPSTQLRVAPIDGVLMLRGGGELWSQYLSLLDSDLALPTKAITAALIIGSGDLTAQVLEKKKASAEGVEVPETDFARVLRWATFGFFVQAPWNHFFYQILDGVLPPTAEPFSAVTFAKVAIDQFGQAPIFTALIFVFFAVLEGRGLQSAKKQIDEELFEVLLKNWAIFLPATIINLAFLPNQLRVLFLNAVFFFWTIFLSLTVNSKKED